jgi:predicted SprT family Zn-dependent metalloprotease
MRIPKKFKLYGLTINVKLDDKMQKEGRCGQSVYRENKIRLNPKIKTRDCLEQTYLHELLHFVLLHSKVVNTYKLENGKELHLDEDFIDNIASLLHQAIVTSKGKLK